jgi:hypothetical protein
MCFAGAKVEFDFGFRNLDFGILKAVTPWLPGVRYTADFQPGFINYFDTLPVIYKLSYADKISYWDFYHD